MWRLLFVINDDDNWKKIVDAGAIFHSLQIASRPAASRLTYGVDRTFIKWTDDVDG